MRSKADFPFYYVSMFLGGEKGSRGKNKNDFILMKEGQAWNNTHVLNAVVKLWQPLTKYLRFDTENAKEHKQRSKERRKENIEWVEIELETKRE